MATGPSCGKRDGDLPNARRGWSWYWFAARDHIVKDEANGILCHGQCFLLILSVRDDFRQRRNTYCEPTFFLRLQNDREPSCLINQNCTLDGLGSLNATANGPAVNSLRNVTLKHVQQKVGTGFAKRTCSNEIERDDDWKKRHPALAGNGLTRRLSPAWRCAAPRLPAAAAARAWLSCAPAPLQWHRGTPQCAPHPCPRAGTGFQK
jgi:hypothetical protein